MHLPLLIIRLVQLLVLFPPILTLFLILCFFQAFFKYFFLSFVSTLFFYAVLSISFLLAVYYIFLRPFMNTYSLFSSFFFSVVACSYRTLSISCTPFSFVNGLISYDEILWEI